MLMQENIFSERMWLIGRAIAPFASLIAMPSQGKRYSQRRIASKFSTPYRYLIPSRLRRGYSDNGTHSLQRTYFSFQVSWYLEIMIVRHICWEPGWCSWTLGSVPRRTWIWLGFHARPEPSEQLERRRSFADQSYVSDEKLFRWHAIVAIPRTF